MTLIRILLADDHAVVRAGIRQFLERAADLQVVAEADDGEMAQQLITEYHPDVAVLDIQMPKVAASKHPLLVSRWGMEQFRAQNNRPRWQRPYEWRASPPDLGLIR